LSPAAAPWSSRSPDTSDSTPSALRARGQLIVTAFAKALEIVPRQLCDNAGFDSNDILSALLKKHAQQDDADGRWYGVDIERGDIIDAFAAGICEPADNKSYSRGYSNIRLIIY
jgi:T-complex protein 1 subunit eta